MVEPVAGAITDSVLTPPGRLNVSIELASIGIDVDVLAVTVPRAIKIVCDPMLDTRIDPPSDPTLGDSTKVWLTAVTAIFDVLAAPAAG